MLLRLIVNEVNGSGKKKESELRELLAAYRAQYDEEKAELVIKFDDHKTPPAVQRKAGGENAKNVKKQAKTAQK